MHLLLPIGAALGLQLLPISPFGQDTPVRTGAGKRNDGRSDSHPYWLTAPSTVTHRIADRNVENLTLAGTGNHLANTLTGNNADNLFNGHDTLID